MNCVRCETVARTPSPAIQAEERDAHRHRSLKVGFNRVFGYYIEISNANRHLVPRDYQRRQTLTGAERYVTPALKEYEEKVLTPTERIETRERELFEALRRGVERRRSRDCRRWPRAWRRSTCWRACRGGRARAVRASRIVQRRLRPRDRGGPASGGRADDAARPVHPERRPADVADARLIILTGPNMAGKSHDPAADRADRPHGAGGVVRAGDARRHRRRRPAVHARGRQRQPRARPIHVHGGDGETSAILHHGHARSLVLLDEIGRGTSTYDGVSIAWAVSEHLHDKVECKTVFATHYHELTQLADELSAVRNFNVAVRESGEHVLFLHRLQPGGADRSYGIEVGRLAGLPAPVIQRARAVLHLLEGEQLVAGLTGIDARPANDQQLGLFVQLHPAIERLQSIDTNHMTPLDALKALDELVQLANRKDQS